MVAIDTASASRNATHACIVGARALLYACSLALLGACYEVHASEPRAAVGRAGSTSAADGPRSGAGAQPASSGEPSSAAGGGASGAADAGAVLGAARDGGAGDFEQTCQAFSDLPRPACSECLGRVQLACSSRLARFVEQCGGTERCAARHCRALCTAARPCTDFCACTRSCLPDGESECKQLWRELLACYLRTCSGTC